MTPREAAKTLKAELVRRVLPFNKISAKTVEFTDLARARAIFVKIHGWLPSPYADELKAFGKANGFNVEFCLLHPSKETCDA
jgi:hypothetical protein